MAQIVRIYTFTDNTGAYGSQVEIEFGLVATAWNNHDSGFSSWTAITTSGNITMSAGKTITLVSPDGSKTINFGVDNSGNYGAM